MFKNIYLGRLGIIISFGMNVIRLLTRPFMVYGYFDRKHMRFLKHTRVSSTATILSPERLDIEDNCWIWHHSIIDASNDVSIGEGCQIGAYVGIFTHSSHIAIRLLGTKFINYSSEDRLGYVRAPVAIGAYTFIGAGALILPGAVIGRGCIVGAGSIVKGNIPDYSIVSGSKGEIVGSVKNMDKKYLLDNNLEGIYFDEQLFNQILDAKEDLKVESNE